MRLTIRILGTEIFHFSTDPEPDYSDDKQRDLSGGNLGSTPVEIGFTRKVDDQRWESGE